MIEFSATIIDVEKYKKLTGYTKNKEEVVSHNKEELLLLVQEKCIELTELTKKRLEKKKKEELRTPDELGEVELIDEIASRLTESSDFPAIARRAVEKIGIYHDEQGYWWIWSEKEKRWKNCDDTTIFNAVDAKLKDSSNTIEQKIKSLLKEALERQARLKVPKELDWHWIQFKDKLINFETDEEMAASNKYFIANPIPWNVGNSTETPVLDNLLKEWLEDKTTRRDINELKDLFAFALPTKYFTRAVPFLHGHGSDGKSQFIKVLKKFVGKGNIASTTMDYLEKSNHGTYSLLKKLVCVLSEIPKNEIVSFTTIKAISGGDSVRIERKFADEKNEELYSKILMVGNDVPITKDQSDGFFTRVVLIKFPNSFAENGEVFERIPDKEYENLAKWCLVRLKTLAKDFKLTANLPLSQKKEEYKKESNQVIKFLTQENYLITGQNKDSIMVFELLGAYNKWADANNKPTLETKELKAKLENLGLTTEVDYTTIGGQKTRRLFVYGLKKVVVIEKELAKDIIKEQKTLFGGENRGN